MTGRMGVIADTHGDVEAWETAVRLWGPVDLIVHAGDVLDGWNPASAGEARGLRSLTSRELPILMRVATARRRRRSPS